MYLYAIILAMLFRKAHQIENLNAQVDNLSEQLDVVTRDRDAIEGSPYYAIAKDLEADVVAHLEGDDVDSVVTDVVERYRSRLVGFKTGVLTRKLARERIEEEKALIKEEVHEAARCLAAEAIRSFLAEDAPDYREEVRAQLATQWSGEFITAAKQQIAAEERQKRIDREAQEMREAEQATLRREAMKGRAHDIRKRTKLTQMLPLATLEVGDPLTICLVENGNGHETLTDYDGWSSAYRSDLERRRIVVTLKDLETGLCEVVKDTIIPIHGVTPRSMRGGHQITIGAINPDNAEEEASIFKGEPVRLRNPDGQDVSIGKLEVWWVNLGDFRALS